MNSASMPRLIVVTSRTLMQPNFELALLNALQGGARLVHFREKDLPPRVAIELFARALRLTEKFGAQLYWNGRADVARWCHAEGAHLPENDISVEAARSILGFHVPVGVSVHSVEAARRAAAEGAGYLIYGSVFPTGTHPGGEVGGLQGLEEVARAVNVPVYAIGGIDASNAPSCLAAGARGVAVIRAAWESKDVSAAIRQLNDSLGEKILSAVEVAHGQASPLAAIIGKVGRD